MNKMTIAIAICTGLTLTACGKSADTESTNPTTAGDSINEQNTTTLTEQQTPPVGVPAESGSNIETQTDQAAFEAGKAIDEKGEVIEGTNERE